MKHLFRLSIILLISLIGEILHAIIPLPVPAGIYGMILMFVSLCTGIVRLESVRTVGMFLIEIMPVMFIPAAVGLLDSWDALKSMLLPCCIALVPVTLIVMAVSGRTTQALIRAQNQKRGENK
ncbi:MAG: CidA/LrgA family protein [Clostridia bacterium]|nr:CidA/LrgA family protein [Clostridia bacterium]